MRDGLCRYCTRPVTYQQSGFPKQHRVHPPDEGWAYNTWCKGSQIQHAKDARKQPTAVRRGSITLDQQAEVRRRYRQGETDFARIGRDYFTVGAVVRCIVTGNPQENLID